MKLEPGVRVTDNVTLVEVIGEGAMGAVWVGEHATLDTKVAVKFIADELSQTREDAVERFKREARAAAMIKSPYVVQMFDHGVTDDGTPYIVMELLEGQSLYDRLEEDGTLSPQDTAGIMAQVSKALTAAHAHGIFHRDIKPHNIFLTDHHGDLHVKVLDFGIAKQSRLSLELTEPGTIVGTPQYVSRDLIMTGDQRTVDAQVDLWSMSVVAYKCLTASLPFDGDTIGKICAALAAGDFTPPSKHRAELGNQFDAWFSRAFDAEPENRFASAQELSDSFAKVVARWERGEAVPTKPPRSAIPAIVLGGLLVGGGIGALLYTGLEPPPPIATPTATSSASSSASAGSSASAPTASAVVVASASAAASSSSAPSLADLPSEMIAIPAGKLWMGCHHDRDLECDADEIPGHRVDVPAFSIDRVEVNVLAYARCVIDGHCSDRRLTGYAIDGVNFVPSTKCNWQGQNRERHPMNCISHPQAARYCEWRGARLPTEVEWERAARGDDKRRYPWGDEPATCLFAVMAEEKDNGCGKNSTWPVGNMQRDESPFGVRDMGGNVREWVADWYDKNLYKKRKQGGQLAGPSNGSRRVARGGGWGNTVARFFRVSHRESEEPESRNMHLGFRCAMDAGDDSDAGAPDAGAQ